MQEKKPKILIRDRIKYRFDNFISSGPKSIFLMLLVMFIIAFLLTALMRAGVEYFILKSGTSENIINDIWLSFLQIPDAGAVAEDTDNSMPMKIVGIVTILLGMIFFSGVIAFITTELDKKMSDLRKGRSAVLEKGHIVVLGWGEMVFEIIKELIVANESGRGSVVILSEMEKDEMDDILLERVPERKTTKIITRNGKTSSLESLRRVGVNEARAVVILPMCSESATDEEKIISDAKVLKTILAVVAASRFDPTPPNIIAEVFDTTRRGVMLSLDPEHITMVETESMIAKIIVQSSRTTGLGVVYDHIIGFSGSEIYFYGADWKGVTFGDLPFYFKDGVPLGIKAPDGKITLNPGNDYRPAALDEIIIIAEDDSSIQLAKKKLYSPVNLQLSSRKLEIKKERELIIGWNAKARIVVEQYTDYIPEGSVIHIVINNIQDDELEEINELKERYPGIELELFQYDPLSMGDLARLKPETYDNVIILNKAEEDTEKLDSTTITTLLLIRQLFREYETRTGSRVTTKLVTEVMNSSNLELVARTGVNDSIISGQMVSKILAQVAENPPILGVYEDLFTEEGSEIYLKPIDLYLDTLPESVTFADLILLAQRRNEILIGYRYGVYADDVDRDFGVNVNMPKDRIIRPAKDDYFIVLSENDL
ncbi:MAG TPA: hypothetical protein PK986_04170 [Spirochaetota bacterium]|nr:hypothetical protein [Spirochaetota bacterium]